MSDKKFSFEANTENLPIPQSVKIDNKRSRYAKQAETKVLFENKAEKAHDHILNNQEQAYALGKQFLDVMKDKTLPENKGPLQQSLEREICGKLINFAVAVNNDDLEPLDGQGSISLLILLFRSNLALRDKYNLLEFKMEQLEKTLKVERKT